MRIKMSGDAILQYYKLPANIKLKADKQFSFLMENIRHPSLHAKKYQENDDLWQGRIDSSWRFYFHIVSPHYVIISIITHPK